MTNHPNPNSAAQAAVQDLEYVVQQLRQAGRVADEEGELTDRLDALLSKLRAPVADERAVRIPVPFSIDTTHKNQAFVTLGFYDEAQRKEFVRAVCSGGFRVPTDALASAPVAGEAVARDDGALSTPNRPESRAKTGSTGGAQPPVAGEAQPVCWIEKDVLESVRDEGSDAWVYWRPAAHVAEHDEMPLYAAPQASAEALKLPRGWQLALNLAIDAIENAAPMDWPVNWPAILHGLKELRAALSAAQAGQGERDA